jgi:hypothetical protein
MRRPTRSLTVLFAAASSLFAPTAHAQSQATPASNAGGNASASSSVALANSSQAARATGVTAALADQPPDPPGPAQSRSGVALGFHLALGTAQSSGYPNSYQRIDDPRFYSSSGPMVGGGGSLFLMGAIADYLNFGVFFGSRTYENSEFRSVGGAIGFRVEAFPLYGISPRLRDFGLFSQLGYGFTTLRPKRIDAEAADGMQSQAGLGAFYEWKLFRALGGHVSGGPLVGYDVIFSPSIVRHEGSLGARLVFYGGP